MDFSVSLFTFSFLAGCYAVVLALGHSDFSPFVQWGSVALCCVELLCQIARVSLFTFFPSPVPQLVEHEALEKKMEESKEEKTRKKEELLQQSQSSVSQDLAKSDELVSENGVVLQVKEEDR